MNFCSECDNLYYVKLDGNDEDAKGNNVIYYCRNCGHEEPINDKNLCVSKTYIKRNDIKYLNIINKYTKYDNTLPRKNNIPCPNGECASNRESNPSPNEIIFIRYDDKQMNYVFICANCDKVWKP
jgi:DNA-directed RNA polymerase subunit M/transcription elongation factor TFIIS